MISRLVFGGNVFGWTVDEPTAFALLDQLVDAGFDQVDTADHYVNWVGDHVGGESETIIGNWFARRGRSDDVKIITKVGFPMGRMGNGEGGKGLGRAHITRSIDRSLQRLRRDYVDIYMAHIDDPDTPIDETLETFGRLVEAGKVRAIGASHYGMERLEEALAISARDALPRFEMFETPYNLYDRAEFETQVAPVAARHGLALLPYRGLAVGFLTGKYRSLDDAEGRARGFRARSYVDERGLGILGALDTVSAATGLTVAQVAIAWLVGRPHVAAPMFSATDARQLSEIIDAVRVELSGDHLRLLDQVSSY